MNCHDVEKFVYVYLDSEFEQRETLEFEAHLESCAACFGKVQFEENYLKGLREKIEPIRAPQQLRDRILAAITDETERIQKANRNRRTTFAGSWWFSGAFATGLLAVIGWQFVTQNSLTSNPSPLPELPIAQVASTQVANNNQRPAIVDTLNRGDTVDGTKKPTTTSSRDQLVSLVSNRVVEHAVDNHESFESFDRGHDPQTLREHLMATQSLFSPPLPESNDTRLLGVRIIRQGFVPQAIYSYDHMGRRVTAVQSLIPKGWGRVQKNPSVLIRRGHKVITYQEDNGVMTSIVCEDAECELSFMDARQISQ